jgi:molybdate transport system substrate-binding protein
MEFLQAEGVWEAVQAHLVFGENIAQTMHFVVSGNASLGLIAGAQAVDGRLPGATCYWPVPKTMHRALVQQAILLQGASDNVLAADFLRYLRGSSARKIITAHGYEVPD